MVIAGWVSVSGWEGRLVSPGLQVNYVIVSLYIVPKVHCTPLTFTDYCQNKVYKVKRRHANFGI